MLNEWLLLESIWRGKQRDRVLAFDWWRTLEGWSSSTLMGNWRLAIPPYCATKSNRVKIPRELVCFVIHLTWIGDPIYQPQKKINNRNNKSCILKNMAPKGVYLFIIHFFLSLQTSEVEIKEWIHKAKHFRTLDAFGHRGRNKFMQTVPMEAPIPQLPQSMLTVYDY